MFKLQVTKQFPFGKGNWHLFQWKHISNLHLTHQSNCNTFWRN